MRPNLCLFSWSHAIISGLFHFANVRSIVGTGLRATAPTQLSLICEVEFLQMMGLPLNKPTPAEEAEAETRHQFAIRANSILAFIECDEEQRPKLREAIIEAMLWAQTQPRLAR